MGRFLISLVLFILATCGWLVYYAIRNRGGRD